MHGMKSDKEYQAESDVRTLTEEEADSIRYDNMAKALDFMMANGEFAKLISDQIEQKLLEITQGGNLPPGNGAGLTPFNTPPPV